MSRYSFSGHESFFCKTIWLKKGYDAIQNGVDFSAPDAVANLGVGKNMVASIRYWMKAFGLTTNDVLSNFANLIFDDVNGLDPFVEDESTLWLLHYYLVKSQVASIYHLTFMDFKREKIEFDRSQLQAFIKRRCNVPEQKNVYNENTVKKDISVLLHNYVTPCDMKSIEDYSAILIDLGLIRAIDNEKYAFADISTSKIAPEILLYALLDYKGQDTTISIDVMQELSLLFGLSLSGFIEKVREIVEMFPDSIAYSDNSGIKNIQFLKPIDKDVILINYFSK